MNKVHIAIAATAGVVVGAAGGFVYAKHRIESYYSSRLDEVVAEVKRHYESKTVANQTFDTPQEAVKALISGVISEDELDEQYAEIAESNRVILETEQYDPSKIVSKNIFENPPKTEWAEHKPHPITLHEALESPEEILTVTWFEGDDTMIDDSEVLIPAPDDFLGEDWKDYFGFESGDDDMVYVKNPKDGSIFEVTRDSGYYTVTVLGQAPPDEGDTEG